MPSIAWARFRKTNSGYKPISQSCPLRLKPFPTRDRQGKSNAIGRKWKDSPFGDSLSLKAQFALRFPWHSKKPKVWEAWSSVSVGCRLLFTRERSEKPGNGTSMVISRFKFYISPSKNNLKARVVIMVLAQSVKWLSCRHEDLNSIPRIQWKNKNKSHVYGVVNEGIW